MFNRIYLAGLVAVAFATSAQAGVDLVASQATFSSLGATTQNTNFDAYPTNGTWTFPGSPFTVGDLTFVEGGQNLIGGTVSYGFARNLITDNYVQGTTVDIAGTHNLLAFNAGNFFSSGDASFDIATNLGNYHFVSSVPNGAIGLQFLGYEAGAGEFFTSFKVSGYNATGLTDIQLGLTQAVPEPQTYALLLAGLAAVGFMSRRKNQA